MTVPPGPHPPSQIEDAPPALSGSVYVDERCAVVALVGEIDLATAPRLGALLDEALGAGATRVVVDMGGVTFMDARGLTALMSSASQLRAAGGRLAVRAVDARVHRVFEITGLLSTLDVERSSVGSTFVRSLASMASMPLARDVLDTALTLVVKMAHAVVVGADGASITLHRDGRLGTAAASNEVVLEMDHDQYDTGEGPCLDAATRGARFYIDSLAQEQRWPEFIPRARARGIESILSTPMVAGDRPIGALNVYSRQGGALAAREHEWADQFAYEAAMLVASAQPNASAAALHGEVRRALQSRETIALAQGVIMERDKLSPTAAHAVLRNISRRTSQPLSEVSADVVSSHGQ